MTMQVSEVRDWLNELAPTDLIGIDEGGLILVGPRGNYIEVGSEPYCFHDAPGLKSGDRCESGEIKP